MPHLLILTAELPALPETPVGVLLYDGDAGRLGVRVRRDSGDEVIDSLEDDLRRKADEFGPARLLDYLEDTASNAIRLSERRPVLCGNFTTTLELLYQRHVPTPVARFRTHLPLYSLRAAAGHFGENLRAEEEGWVEAPAGLRLNQSMFVAQVTGRSMEPRIPDGSLCIFRAGVAGSRHGRLVLVENLSESDEGGERYTVKRYHRPPGARDVVMQPLNPEFSAWPIDPELAEEGRIRVIAEFVSLLR